MEQTRWKHGVVSELPWLFEATSNNIQNVFKPLSME